MVITVMGITKRNMWVNITFVLKTRVNITVQEYSYIDQYFTVILLPYGKIPPLYCPPFIMVNTIMDLIGYNIYGIV
jgi:hypothetical protein